MQMRLAFAVAAQLNPEILVIDEVLAVGDANFQKKCLGKMGEVTRGGRTVLFVSHNQGAVQNLCTRALLLHQGRLEYEGGVDEAFVRYAALSGDLAAGTADLTHQPRDPRFLRRYARLQSLSLLDGAGNPTETLVMGQPCSFVLEADFLQTGSSYEIGLAVSSFHGVAVHYLMSNWEGFQTIARTGRQRIEARLPAVHLFPGNYVVSVWVKQQGTIHDDAVEEALAFRVEEGQFTPGHAYFHRYSSNTQVYVPTTWKLLD
jgi:lipopolysaccharide transport system ATP-binding protein